MTLPEKPTDLLPLSDARWLAALDMAVSRGSWHFTDWADFFDVSGKLENAVADRVDVARLLIKAGEVPEPVDPLDEAWARVNSSFLGDEPTIRSAVEKHFTVTPKGDA